MTESTTARPSLWLIANREHGGIEVFTLYPGGDGETLPVFGRQEEAEEFLAHRAPGKGWEARHTTAGELVSMLYGPCAGVKRVVQDPPPGIDGEATAGLVGADREEFARDLVGEARFRPRRSGTAPIDPGLATEGQAERRANVGGERRAPAG